MWTQRLHGLHIHDKAMIQSHECIEYMNPLTWRPRVDAEAAWFTGVRGGAGAGAAASGDAYDVIYIINMHAYIIYYRCRSGCGRRRRSWQGCTGRAWSSSAPYTPTTPRPRSWCRTRESLSYRV